MNTAPSSFDPLGLASRLIACPSVTPARGSVFDAIEAMLTPLGFAVDRFIVGQDASQAREVVVKCRCGEYNQL